MDGWMDGWMDVRCSVMVCMCMLLTLSIYLTCLCICLGAPDAALLAARKAALLRRACEILPRLATYDSTSELWTGLRPMTPGSFHRK